ncbi:MAG: polymer-forming cytoskeletal protein [Oscillospiraceae bacterium]|nr:polymer-forming cytoskeletal protein [Oscillospiraceae bacterium]
MKRLNKVGKNITGIVIGGGVIIENAALRGSGVLRIDGEFHGSIDIDGHVILGKTGVINGNIHAESALFAGTYHGNLQIRNTLHLTSTAVLHGQIDAGNLIVDEGGIFNGTCSVTSRDAQRMLDAPDAAVFDGYLYKDAET